MTMEERKPQEDERGANPPSEDGEEREPLEDD